MKVVDSEKVEWNYGPGHRDSGLALRDVLVGPEGGAGNYWLSIIHVAEKYNAPRHRHNFDQVRVMLAGAFNFGDQDQEEGTIGYFSEGTAYTQKARGASITLLLQCEGGSGSRFVSQNEMATAVKALRQRGGEFVGGRFNGPDPISAEPVNKDSYEAIWEHIVGKRLVYPEGRYQKPVIMRPEAFAYMPFPGAPGVEERALGVFNERKIGISMWRYTSGAVQTYSHPTRTLVYVKSGVVTIDGERLGPKFAAEIGADETVHIKHAEGVPEIIAFNLPS